MQFNQFYIYTAAKYCLAFTVFDFNIRMHSPRIKEYIKNLSRKKMIDFVFFLAIAVHFSELKKIIVRP